jgi:hypothetical protein
MGDSMGYRDLAWELKQGKDAQDLLGMTRPPNIRKKIDSAKYSRACCDVSHGKKGIRFSSRLRERAEQDLLHEMEIEFNKDSIQRFSFTGFLFGFGKNDQHHFHLDAWNKIKKWRKREDIRKIRKYLARHTEQLRPRQLLISSEPTENLK